MSRDCRRGPIGLDTIGDQTFIYRGVAGYEGGYYGQGSNSRTAFHNAAVHRAASLVQPLDAAGSPSITGKIGLVGFGFSDARLTMEEVLYQLPSNMPRPELVAVNCAKDGKDASDWADLNNDCWVTHVPAQLAAASLTANQVQVAWIMTGVRSSVAGFPKHVDDLSDLMKLIAANARLNWPNIKLLYIDTVPSQHYQSDPNYQEPLYFEQGFAVRKTIQAQLAGDPALCFDQSMGGDVAPVLDWGAKFWVDGTRADSRGYIWECDDVQNDGHHPSKIGSIQLAEWLIKRWRDDGAARVWLYGNQPEGQIGGSGGSPGTGT